MPTTQSPQKRRRVAGGGRSTMHLRNRVPRESAPGGDTELAPVRVLVFAAVIAASFLILIGRLWFLQIAHGAEALAEAENNQRTSIRVLPPRGIIEDRNHKLLITNTSRIDVFMVPDRLDEWIVQEMQKSPRRVRTKYFRALYDGLKTSAYQRLVDILEDGTTVEELQKNFVKNQQPGNSDPTLVKPGITEAQFARIIEGLSDLPGVIPQLVPVRSYPQGRLGAQVLGYIKKIDGVDWKAEQKALQNAKAAGKDTDDLPNHRQTDLLGIKGLEKYYDRILAGTPGNIDYAVTAQRKRVKVVETTEAIPGAKLTLTLDGNLQRVVEKLLEGKKGAAVALDPRNGSVLAMHSFPSYDPSAYQRPINDVMAKELSAGQSNKASGAKWPPGSTFKIVSSIAGLSEKKIGTGTYFSCPGKYLGLNCDGVHGSQSLSSALTVSCDTYFYHVGQLLGEEKQKLWCKNLGLGEKTGIDLPTDTTGSLSSSERKALNYEKYAKDAAKAGNLKRAERLLNDAKLGLSLGERMQTAIGQGFTTVSPLQMAQVVSVVATGGKIYRPHLLDRAVAGDGSGRVVKKTVPELMREIKLTRQQWNAIRSGLRGAVTSGTARKSVSGSPFYIAGKTGTAEVGKTSDRQNYAWFVCYASRKAGETPTIAVAVCLEPGIAGQHGGDVAAPIARRIVEAHFGLQANDKVDLAASADGD